LANTAKHLYIDGYRRLINGITVNALQRKCLEANVDMFTFVKGMEKVQQNKETIVKFLHQTTKNKEVARS